MQINDEGPLSIRLLFWPLIVMLTTAGSSCILSTRTIEFGLLTS